MKENLAIQIRRALSRYLTGELTLKQFLRNYLPKLSTIRVDEPLDEFAHEVYVRIAEYANGDWTEAELKDVLRPIVSTYVVEWPRSSLRMKTGTSTASRRPERST